MKRGFNETWLSFIPQPKRIPLWNSGKNMMGITVLLTGNQRINRERRDKSVGGHPTEAHNYEGRSGFTQN
jgi:hypothetical protein